MMGGFALDRISAEVSRSHRRKLYESRAIQPDVLTDQPLEEGRNRLVEGQIVSAFRSLIKKTASALIKDACKNEVTNDS